MRFSIGKTQHFRKAEKEAEVIAETEPPFVVTLVPDPENKHDPNAIKVMCKRQHIGFVPSMHTKLVTAGPAKFVERESRDGWIIEAPGAAEASHNAVPAPPVPSARTKARAAPVAIDLTEDEPTPPTASALQTPPVTAPAPAPTVGAAGVASGSALAADSGAAAEAKAEAVAKRLAKLRRKREEQAVGSPSKAPRT